jgi:transposase
MVVGNDYLIERLISTSHDSKYLWYGERLNRDGLNFHTQHHISNKKWIRIDVGREYIKGANTTYLTIRFFDGNEYHLAKRLLARRYMKIYDLFDICKEKAR